MISSFTVLLEYVTDLLKPERPPLWRSIETADPIFKSHIACMKGYEDILRTAGYTEKKETFLQFPDTIQEPNKAKLSVLAAELLMARVEVEMKNAVPQQRQEITSNQSLSSACKLR